MRNGRIDGVIDSAEWSGAATQPFLAEMPDGTFAPATLYVMNDNLNLYLAIRAQHGYVAAQHYVSVTFDSDGTNSFSIGDDYVQLASGGSGTGTYDGVFHSCSICVHPDAWQGGTDDAKTAFLSDGQFASYELSHEIISGDANDAQLAAGSTIGFNIVFQVLTNTNYGTTNDPGHYQMDQIQIGSCLPQSLSGCGSAFVDGKLKYYEWLNAARHRLSVWTPEGDTTPATLYVMNDQSNLYFALRTDRAISDPETDLWIEFDNDGSSCPSDYDDVIDSNKNFGFNDQFRLSQPPCPSGGPICSVLDTDFGGTNDGAGAFLAGGIDQVHEISHPFAGGDWLDLGLKNGSSIGTFLALSIKGKNGALAFTMWPNGTYVPVTVGYRCEGRTGG